MSMKPIFRKLTACALSAVCVLGSLTLGGKQTCLREIHASAAASYKYGDVTRDGILDDVDATQILRYYARNLIDASNNTLFDMQQVQLADADRKNGVTEADAVAVLNYFVKSLVGKAPTDWPVYTEPPVLTIDNSSYPFGLSTAQMTALYGTPADSLSEARTNYTLTYHIYSSGRKDFKIVMTANDSVVGYYVLGGSVHAESGIVHSEYVDLLETERVYACLAMRSGYRVSYNELSNLSDLSVYSKLCWYLTNAIRAKEGVAATKWSDTAAKCARAHSADMAKNNYFDHTSLNGDTFSKRLTDAGINWRGCAENIAAGQMDAFQTIDSWYNSVGHRENMLAGYQNLGIGFVYDANSKYRIYGTQDFYTAFGE